MTDPHGTATAPGDDEPRSPAWLPGLGAALFILAGLVWAASGRAPPTAAPSPSPATGDSGSR
jgi:hypothetical protein